MSWWFGQFILVLSLAWIDSVVLLLFYNNKYFLVHFCPCPLQASHEGHCDFMIILCPSCKELMRANEQERHNERECPERTLNCKYCKEPFLLKNIKVRCAVCTGVWIYYTDIYIWSCNTVKHKYLQVYVLAYINWCYNHCTLCNVNQSVTVWVLLKAKPLRLNSTPLYIY